VFIVRNHLVCKDGTTISVRASADHYCRPQTDEGPWETFEVGTPPREDDVGVSLQVTEEVWAYINEHGGLDLSALLKSLKSLKSLKTIF
jgi:hypothetical protein